MGKKNTAPVPVSPLLPQPIPGTTSTLIEHHQHIDPMPPTNNTLNRHEDEGPACPSTSWPGHYRLLSDASTDWLLQMLHLE